MAAWLATNHASAQDDARQGDAARALFNRGVAAADELRWAEAASWFERSYALVPRPATLRNLGLADRALGRYLRAIRELERFLAVGSPTPSIAREVQRLIAEMRARVATLTLDVTPANASLLVDGATVLAETPVELDPGNHSVEGSAPGFLRTTRSLSLNAGERQRLQLSLDRVHDAAPRVSDAPAAPSERGGVLTRWWFWTAIGLVVAGGVATTVILLTPETPPDCGSLGTCLTPQ